MTTIAELVIAASVEPSGVQRGFDQALGYSKRFAQQADIVFKNVGMGEDNVTKARLILHRIESEFQLTNNRLKEQFLRGALDPARFASEARQAGVAMNQALLAALEGFRSKGIFDNEAEAIFMNRLRADFASVQQTAGGGVGGLSKAGGLIGDLGRLSHGGAAGLGLMRREMLSLFASITNTLPLVDRLGNTLLSYQAGGAISFGVIAGITAIAGAYYVLTKSAREAAEENKKALESIRSEIDKTSQHISERAVIAAEANVKTAQERVNQLNRDLSVRASMGSAQQTLLPQIGTTTVVDRAKQEAELREANRVLAAALQNRNNLQRDAAKAGDEQLDSQLNTLVKYNNATKLERQLALARLKEYEDEAVRLAKTGEDNQRRVFDLEQAKSLRETLFPKTKAIHDKEPFPELKAHVQDLSTAYRDLREMGIGPTIALQNEAEEQFLRLGRMIAMLPDQTGRAARSLLEMQRQLLTAGIHANDALLSLQIQIGPPLGGEDKTAADLARRASLMRDAIGPLSDAAMAALTAEQRFLRVVDLRIESAGGASRASEELLKARAAILKDIEDSQKDVGASILSPEDKESIRQSVADTKDFLAGTRRLADGWNDVRAAIQGALDVLDAFGGMNSNVRQIANGALHLANTFRQIQKDREDRAKTSAKDSVTGDGAPSGTSSALDLAKKGGALSGLFGVIGTVGQYLGAIGAGIGLIRGVVGLFSHHNQALEDNTKRLVELRLAMVDTKGVAGQTQELQALENLRKLYSTPQFRLAGSGARNQMIEDAVNQAGLSIDQFNKIMKDFGIVPEKSGEWLNQLGEAIRMATDAATRYGHTLDDQAALIDLHNKVFGKDTPQDAIQKNVQLLNEFAPSLANAINGIDTTTAAGRDQLQAALENWVTMIENNQITPEMLGTLTGVKDFGEIIGALEDSLGSLKDTTDKATASMDNVPSWYKIAGAVWRAAAPEQMPLQLPVSTTPTDVRPQIPFQNPQLNMIPDRKPYVPTSTPSSTGMVAPIQFNGPITVQTQATDGEQLFRTFLKVAQSKSQTQFGTTTKWSQLQRP